MCRLLVVGGPLQLSPYLYLYLYLTFSCYIPSLIVVHPVGGPHTSIYPFPLYGLDTSVYLLPLCLCGLQHVCVGQRLGDRFVRLCD